MNSHSHPKHESTGDLPRHHEPSRSFLIQRIFELCILAGIIGFLMSAMIIFGGPHRGSSGETVSKLTFILRHGWVAFVFAGVGLLLGFGFARNKPWTRVILLSIGAVWVLALWASVFVSPDDTPAAIAWTVI